MAEGDQLPAKPPEYKDIVLTTEQVLEARRRYPEVSERKAMHFMKLSVLADLRKNYTKPDGTPLFGGRQPGSGRKPTKRIGTAIVEHFEGRQKEVLDAIAAPLDANSNASAMERHKAGMNIAKHEREERALQMAEDDFARRTDDDIQREMARVMAEMVLAGKITLQDIAKMQGGVDVDADVPEADVVEQGTLSA